MTDNTSADLEIVLAETFGRKPQVEQTGNTIGLAVETHGNRPLEQGARAAAMEAAAAEGRELVTLAQTRGGMSVEAAESMVDAMCSRAYEESARHSAFESDRFGAVIKTVQAKASELRHKTPLVTESQSNGIRRAAANWRPQRVKISEHCGRTGQDRAPTMDEQIVNALEGR